MQLPGAGGLQLPGVGGLQLPPAGGLQLPPTGGLQLPGMGGMRPPAANLANFQNLMAGMMTNMQQGMQGGKGMMPGMMPKMGGMPNMPPLGKGAMLGATPGLTLPGAPVVASSTSKASASAPTLPGLGALPGLGGAAPLGALAKGAPQMAPPQMAPPQMTPPVASVSIPAQPAAPCTVYVGRISSEVSDDFVRGLLEKCGKVSKWNRAADPNTSKLTSFGFCDFEEPQGLWRALQFLHEKQLCDKRLLVKCEEKVMQNIVQWKATRKVEFEKPTTEDKIREILGSKDTNGKAPLITAEKLDEALAEESKAVSEDIEKMLKEKNKGYPEVKGDGTTDEKDDAKGKKDETKKDDDNGKKDDEKKEAEKDKKDDDKGGDDKGKENRENKDDKPRLSKSEEKRREDRKNAVSRHYRPSRRERERDDRVRNREKDIDKEYQYRLREFERNEEPRLKNLKRDLREVEMVAEPDERTKRKFVERDLDFGRDDHDEREWKRYRLDRQKDREREHEKDRIDRAAEQKEVEEERRKKEAEEKKKRKEIEEEEAKKKKEAEDERRRIEAEEKAKRDAEKKAKQEEEERVRQEELRKENEAKRKVQAAAAAELLKKVQEEMRVAVSRPLTAKDGPGAHPLFAEGQENKQRPPPIKVDGESKLKEDDMRKLIQQVPTDKAKAFLYPIDWQIVHDHNIIEKKLRPWVKKKVAEYLGAEEQGMVEFIMRKVAAHTKPDSILDELEGFLDDEAENFTLKMWRMLIFEVLRVSISMAGGK